MISRKIIIFFYQIFLIQKSLSIGFPIVSENTYNEAYQELGLSCKLNS